MGAEAGDSRSFTLEPEDAYGHPSDALIQEVPRSMFPADMPIDLGMMLMSDAGPFRIIAITDTNIKCDFNPPMAGKILHFDVEVVGVRAATKVKSPMDMYTDPVVFNTNLKNQLKAATLLAISINRVVALISGTIEGLDPFVTTEEFS